MSAVSETNESSVFVFLVAEKDFPRLCILFRSASAAYGWAGFAAYSDTHMRLFLRAALERLVARLRAWRHDAWLKTGQFAFAMCTAVGALLGA